MILFFTRDNLEKLIQVLGALSLVNTEEIHIVDDYDEIALYTLLYTMYVHAPLFLMKEEKLLRYENFSAVFRSFTARVISSKICKNMYRVYARDGEFFENVIRGVIVVRTVS